MSVVGSIFLAGLALALPMSASADARTDYMINCMGCHKPDGSGTNGDVPSLIGSMGRFLSVPGGREYLVQVPGTAQSLLNHQRTADVINWMLYRYSEAQLPRSFAPYTEEEVALYRSVPLMHPDKVREKLMSLIGAALDVAIDERK